MGRRTDGMEPTPELAPSHAQPVEQNGVALLDESGVAEKLRAAGVPLTLQRLAIGQAMLSAPVHLTADQVLARVRAQMPEVSRATVYNTLKLFVDRGLARELVIDAERVVFDSNVEPHHHLYEIESGQLTDVSAADLKVVGSPSLPADVDLESIEVVLRVRRRKA